jgi:hypothetical protein
MADQSESTNGNPIFEVFRASLPIIGHLAVDRNHCAIAQRPLLHTNENQRSEARRPGKFFFFQTRGFAARADAARGPLDAK